MPNDSTAACRLSVLASLFLFALACETLPRLAVGPQREITVITTHWDVVAPVVESLFSRRLATPQPEKEFSIRVGNQEKFETYSQFRLILLMGTTRDNLMRQILGSRLDSLPGGDFGLFRIPNPWMRNQTVIAFVAAAESLLLPGLELYGARLYHEVREAVLAQAARAVYQRGVDQRLTDSIARSFAFTIDVPKDWQLGGSGAGRFLYLFTHFPDRGAAVHWRDTLGPLVVDSVLNLRDDLAKQFYDGDSVDRSFTKAETLEYLGVSALRIVGVWQNRKLVAGGPFVSYAFNFRGRYYLLDGYVFNPGRRKLEQLGQVEAVLRTFLPR